MVLKNAIDVIHDFFVLYAFYATHVCYVTQYRIQISELIIGKALSNE